MLHDNHGIAFVPELFQRGDELAVVPLVQTDGRLVEKVDYVHELGAYLGCKSYALALATRQRCGRTVKAEIVKTYIQKELHPVGKLLENISRNCESPSRQLSWKVIYPMLQRADFHSTYLGDGKRVYLEPLRFLLEPGTAADRADHPVLDILDHTGPVRQFDLPSVAYREQFVGPEYQQAYHVVRQPTYRLEYGEFVFAGNGPDNLRLAVGPQLAERYNRTVIDTERPVWYYLVHTDIHDAAKSLAMRTIAFGRVERERMWRRLLERDPAFRVHQML